CDALMARKVANVAKAGFPGFDELPVSIALDEVIPRELIRFALQCVGVGTIRIVDQKRIRGVLQDMTRLMEEAEPQLVVATAIEAQKDGGFEVADPPGRSADRQARQSGHEDDGDSCFGADGG